MSTSTTEGADLHQVVILKTQQDQQQLLRRPDGTKPLNDIEFWYARP